MDNKELTQIFEGRLSGNPLDEILDLAEQFCPQIDLELLRKVHGDLATIYAGGHPEFRKSTLPYHNLRHTQMVVLASARLFHGLHCNGVRLGGSCYLKGLLAAYFHDTGLLLREEDPADSGTEYMSHHELRSIRFLSRYVSALGLPPDIAEDSAIIIRYTDLDSDPASFPDHEHEIQLAGQVVGSSDILAQMADRYYLECLPLLFDELEAGGLNQHQTALDLMAHTANFYHDVVLKRLIVTFSHTSRAMRSHFRQRYRIDRNLYMENIDKNIAYLKKILRKCKDIEALSEYLKRVPPVI